MWILVLVWILGGILFGITLWFSIAAAIGVLSPLGRVPAAYRRVSERKVGLPLQSSVPACRLHLVHAERPASWHLQPLHVSHSVPSRVPVRTGGPRAEAPREYT